MRKGGKPVRFADVEDLQRRIAQETPAPGDYLFDYKLEQVRREGTLTQEQFHSVMKVNYVDLPLSFITQRGLASRGFAKLTEVQRCVIPHALGGRDIMACSKTGSGKTLAYLVPLVEKLYRTKFIPADGLGAIVLVPVRQLAMQVFQVLNSFSEKGQLSVGLIIGGKDVKYQQERIGIMNILVCTPGRLLQHLQETYGFQTSNLQMLVLDEADVMLEMGFREPLRAILSHLPRTQTLFFSATLSPDIHQLARDCMTEPERIFLHAKEGQTEGAPGGVFQAPVKLTQYYMVVKAQQKLNILFSFLKAHPKQKILVFVSTCKQVRFIYESFRKFRLGSPLYELQGHQKQKKRMAIYFTFCEKRHGILLCTNIAARGLDFPLVDWVIQLDLPDQIETYVHRVGRTARYRAQGRSLLLLTEQEKNFAEALKLKGLQVHKISQNPQKYLRVESSLQSICSQHQDVKYLAQRALVSYLKFVHKAHSKQYFRIDSIDLPAFAASYGLQTAPVIAFPKRNQQSEQDQGLSKIERLRLKAKMKKSQIKQIKQQLKGEQLEYDERQQKNEDQDEGFLKIKGVVRGGEERPILSTSKRQLKKIKNEGHFQGKNKVIFDEELGAVPANEYIKHARVKSNKEEVDFDAVAQMEARLAQNKIDDEAAEKLRRKVRRRKNNDFKEGQRRVGATAQLASSDEQEG